MLLCLRFFCLLAVAAAAAAVVSVTVNGRSVPAFFILRYYGIVRVLLRFDRHLGGEFVRPLFSVGRLVKDLRNNHESLAPPPPNPIIY